MAGNYASGLDGSDLGLFPGGSNTLEGMGLDPDQVRANPELLRSLAQGGVVPPSPSAVAAGTMGGAGTAPSTPAAATAAPGATPAPQSPTARDFAMRGLASLDENANAATKTAQDIQTSNPGIDALEAKRGPLSTPTPLYDPQTGKMLTQDKPSGWTRFGRGVRGATVGLLTGGIPGAIVGAIEPQDIAGGKGYGAPNKQYDNTERTRQNQLASVDQSLNEARENWKSQVDAQKAKASEFRSNAALGKDETTGGTGIMNADTSAVKEQNDNPDAKNKSSLDLKQQEYEQRSGQLISLEQRVGKVPPATEAYFLANGKMPDPKQPREPSAEEIMLNQAMGLFKQQNGRRPSFDEYMKLVAGVRGKGDGEAKPPTPSQINSLNDKKKSAIDKATENYRKTFDPKAYQQDLQAAQDEFERDAEELGKGGPHNVVTVDSKGQPVWTPENSTQAAATVGGAGAAPVPPAAAQGLQAGEAMVTMPDGNVYAIAKDKVAEAVRRGGKVAQP